MADVISRHEAIAHRVNGRYPSGYGNDPVYHASIKQIRNILAATEDALAAEGVDEATRDRVLYRLIYGEAPHTYPVPDSREALDRLRARDEQMQQLAKLPIPSEWRP